MDAGPLKLGYASRVHHETEPLFGHDTHPDVAARLIEGYRLMTPAEKWARVEDLNRTLQVLAKARLKSRYPEATAQEQRLRLGALRLGRDIMVRAYGWDPSIHGW